MLSQPILLAEMMFVHWTMLIYGATGAGKSVFAGRSQNMRTFIFDIDRGVDSVRAWPDTKPRQVTVWPIGSYDDFKAAFTWLLANIQYYDLVVVDTATELQKYVRYEIMKRVNHIVADQRDWGIILDAMEEVGRQFRMLPCNVVWLCHEVRGLDEETQTMMYMPSFQGAFRNSYGKHFSLIARYQLFDQQVQDPATKAISKVTHRFLNCQRDQVTDAKDRSNVLAKYEPPDIDYLIAKMSTSISRQGTADA